MAESRVAVYGAKRIPVPDGMTQEQVKAQMARFFPELADPKIESKKVKDATEWVFSKKAGTKGAGAKATGGGVAHALESVKVDGVRVSYSVERRGALARGVFQLHGERHETRWQHGARFVASAVTKLVVAANQRAAALAAERARLEAWNAGLPKVITPAKGAGAGAVSRNETDT